MKNQIVKNIFSNYFANFLQMGLGIMIVPFLIHKLGKNTFGIIVLVETLIGFFEIMATSVRVSLSRYVTFSLSQNNKQDFLEYLSSGRYILFLVTGFVFIIGSLLSLYFQKVFQVPANLVGQSKVLFFIINLSFVFTIPNIIYWSILYAKQRFDLINTAFSMGIILRAFFIFLIFSLVPASYNPLIIYGFIYLSMKLMENFLVYRWHKSVVPDIVLSLSYFRFDRIKHILSFSAYSSLTSIAFLLYENTAIILVNILYGPAVNAIYAVSLKIPTMLKNLFARATWTLNPTITDLVAKNDNERIESLFFVYSRAISIATIPLCLWLFFMANKIITLWVGKDFIQAAYLLMIHLVPLVIILPLEAVNCIVNAHAKVKVPSQMSLLAAVCNVILGMVLAKVFSLGLYGFAISAAFFTLLYSAVFMPYYSCKLAGISLKKYLLNAFVQPFLLAVLVVGGYLVLNALTPWMHTTSLRHLAFESCFLLMVYYSCAYHLLLNPEEKELVHGFLKLDVKAQWFKGIYLRFGKNIFNDLKFIISCMFYPWKTKALYIGYTGYGNLGDEALRESIFQLLKPTFLLSESEGFLIRLCIKSGLLKFKTVILGGGTLILNTLFPSSLLHKMTKPNIPQKIVFGTGVVNPLFPENPIKEEDIKEWVGTLDNVCYLSVRGPLSAQILKEKNVQKPIHIIGDPAFYFIRDIKSGKSKTKRMGVNIGNTKSGVADGVMWGGNEEQFLREFISFIKLMLNEGWVIDFIPMCKEDEGLIKRLLIENRLQHKIGIFTSYNSTKKTLDRLEKFDVFVGEKLHSVILSYCANTPAIMLEYRPKCRDFMASIDMEQFNIRTDEFKASKVKDLVEELYINLEDIRIKTNGVCKVYKNELIRASKHVTELKQNEYHYTS